MTVNSGILVKYTNKEGKTQKGLIANKDQRKEFLDKNKALVRLLNDDFTPLKNKGKNVVVLKSIDLLDQIGFSD